LDQKFVLKYKLALLILFIFMVMLGSSEYNLILERFVKVICTSCIGL
jgi:hypothetical protein